MMFGIGVFILDLVAPFLESIAPLMPGEIFPFFFKWEMFQRAFIASIMVTVVAGFLGVFLIIQNMSLIGDGLAHVSFGGVAVALVAVVALTPIVAYCDICDVIGGKIVSAVYHWNKFKYYCRFATLNTGSN